jgi:hypothetical protein
MDTSGLIPAFAAILGSTVGGPTTFATTFEELKKLTDERPADLWHEFTKACRAEREVLLKRL